jgi:hypothetical protein
VRVGGFAADPHLNPLEGAGGDQAFGTGGGPRRRHEFPFIGSCRKGALRRNCSGVSASDKKDYVRGNSDAPASTCREALTTNLPLAEYLPG